jgi:signal transduction histidine kinase
VHTVVGALLLALWIPATIAPHLPDDRGPWLLGVLASSVATAVIAWPTPVVWGFVAAISIASGVVRYVTRESGDVVLAVQDAVSVLTFCMFIAALLLVTLRAGRDQDSALAVALADARSAAEVESRARQRARFGSFVHDDVITTLLAAARAKSKTPAIGESARRALGRLDQFVAAGPKNGQLSSSDFEVELRSAASEIADGVQFSGSLSAYSGGIPAPVAVAMTGALGEAIRNSVRHAGGGSDPIARRVAITATERSIVIEASDDGRGFDPKRTAPERLGIRTSIVGRMSAVTGCAARVSSVPGQGTRVLLSWNAKVSV